MIMISIQMEDSLCKIRINNNISIVELEKKMTTKISSKWIDITIFSTIFKGLLILFEKKILSRTTKNVLIG
jgi:hypothetical protein